MRYHELRLTECLNNIPLDKCCSTPWNRWADNIQAQEVDGERRAKEAKDYNSEQGSLGRRICSREEDKMVMSSELVNPAEPVKGICLVRALLYGRGYPRQPFPGGNFIERLYVKT